MEIMGVLSLVVIALLPSICVGLYIIFGNPSKEFMDEIKDYHPPGHE